MAASNDQNVSVDTSAENYDQEIRVTDNRDNATGVDASQNLRPPGEDGKQPNLTINEIRIQQTRIEQLDILKFIVALTAGMSVYYPNRTRLYDLHENIKLDGHLTGLMEKRADAVLNKQVEYHDANGKKVDAMDDLINSKVFRDIMQMILDAPLHGVSGLEFIPGKKLDFAKVPRKNIVPKNRVITLDQNLTTGIPYDTLPLVWVINDDPDDLGKLTKCAPYAIYKRGNYGDWANFIEIFGIPMRIIEYDANDQQTKIELRQVLDESGSALALMIPKQANFKALDGKQTNGDGQLQERFKDSLNAEMSVIMVANTETTTQTAHNGGTNAKAKTHAEQQNEGTKSNIIYTANWLNDEKFINILKAFCYPVVEGGKFVFKKDLDVDFLTKRIEIDTQLPEDLPIDDDYWYTTYGIPKPVNYDKMKKELQDKQKALKAQDDIQNDPQNQPAKGPKKPANKKKPKTAKALIREALRFFN